jgi:hypothetical protein
MSLFAEMFSLLALAGLVGVALGWLLHGRCDDASYHDSQERGL